jgi:hypothetical protein
MKYVFVLIIFLGILSSGVAYSTEVVEVRDMGEMLAQIKLEKKQMENSYPNQMTILYQLYD